MLSRFQTEKFTNKGANAKRDKHKKVKPTFFKTEKEKKTKVQKPKVQTKRFMFQRRMVKNIG